MGGFNKIEDNIWKALMDTYGVIRKEHKKNKKNKQRKDYFKFPFFAVFEAT